MHVGYQNNLSGTREIFFDTPAQCPLVNKLATHCLLYGCQAKKEHIDDEVVRLAAPMKRVLRLPESRSAAMVAAGFHFILEC
ncbi:hypothetical protein [Thermincola ferriacetica]